MKHRMTAEPVELHVIACFSLKQFPDGHPALPAQVGTCAKCDTRVWLPPHSLQLLARDSRQRVLCIDCVNTLATSGDCERVELKHMKPLASPPNCMPGSARMSSAQAPSA